MGPFPDATIEKTTTRVMGGPHPFGLAVFSSNMAGGTNLTSADGTPMVTWAETVRIARAADAAGFDAIIPVARWRRPGVDQPPERHRSFEPFTWAAGVAMATERIQVFATVHVPAMHPVRAAKAISTVDHISGGRFGLHVVAGWDEDEFRMFDHALTEYDQRYQMASEWLRLVERIFTESQPLDASGRWFPSTDVVSQPRPIQRPGPPIMSAGITRSARAFAAEYADLSFVLSPDRRSGRAVTADVKQTARERYGRKLLVFGAAHVLCRDSEAEADADYAKIVHELGDWDGAGDVVAHLVDGRDPTEDQGGPDLTESAIFGFFAEPLVGTPHQIVAKMAEIHQDGFDGLALSWVDYDEGIAQYREQLHPLLVEAGLRVDEPALGG